jgi:hypothetical protein
MTTAASSSSTTASSVRGISFVQQAVLDVLNETFDPAEVARGAALAKLDEGKKKKKKKNNQEETVAVEPELSDEEKQAIAENAAAQAKPFSFNDCMVTAATKAEFGDYQCNAAMGLAKSVGMNPRYRSARYFVSNVFCRFTSFSYPLTFPSAGNVPKNLWTGSCPNLVTLWKNQK